MTLPNHKERPFVFCLSVTGGYERDVADAVPPNALAHPLRQYCIQHGILERAIRKMKLSQDGMYLEPTKCHFPVLGQFIIPGPRNIGSQRLHGVLPWDIQISAPVWELPACISVVGLYTGSRSRVVRWELLLAWRRLRARKIVDRVPCRYLPRMLRCPNKSHTKK